MPGREISELLARIVELREAPAGNELVESLNRLASLEFRNNPEKTEQYASEALPLAEELGLDIEKGVSLRMLGVSHWARGDYARALADYRRSLEVFERIDHKPGIAGVYNNIGVVYLEQGAMDQALEHFLISLRIKEECGDRKALAHSYVNVANIYSRVDRFDEALNYYNRALAIHEEEEDLVKIADYYTNVGLLHRRKGNLDEALECIKKGLELRENTEDSKGIAHTLSNIGKIYLDMDKSGMAIEYLQSSLDLRVQMGDMMGICDTYTHMGDAWLRMGELDSAEEVLKKSLNISESIGASCPYSETLEHLSSLYEKKGDLENAIRYARELSGATEQRAEETRREKLARMQILFETERREQEAEILRTRNTELEDLVKLRTSNLLEVNEGLKREIAERRRADQARYRAEADLHSFLNNVEDMVYFQASDGSVSHLNSACINVTGYCREEFDEAPGLFMRIIHPEDIEYRLEFLGSGRRKPLVSNHEYQLERKNGTWSWIHSHMVAIRDTDGEIIGYNCIDRDFSERKEADNRLQKSFRNLEKSFRGTIFTMSKIVETRDPYTSGHQMRTAKLARAIARHIGLSEDQTQAVFLSAVVHDIGKISIPQEFLSKPGKLNDLEMQLIKAHPKVSYQVLQGIEFPWPIADIVLQHHEHLDGSGYPEGLKGDEICLEARILCVADVVEAMSSDRPYRPKLGEKLALKELILNRGVLYDPDIVDACCLLLENCNYKLEDIIEPELEESTA